MIKSRVVESEYFRKMEYGYFVGVLIIKRIYRTIY